MSESTTETDTPLARRLKLAHLALLVVGAAGSCAGGAVIASARAVVATRAYATEYVDRAATQAASRAVSGFANELHAHVDQYERVGKPVMLGFRTEVRTHNARVDGALEALCEATPRATAKCLRILTAPAPPDTALDPAPGRY